MNNLMIGDALKNQSTSYVLGTLEDARKYFKNNPKENLYKLDVYKHGRLCGTETISRKFAMECE